MKKILLTLCVVVFLLPACQPAATPPPTAIPATRSPSPQDVVYLWQDALNKGDIDLALSYLAQDAVVTISPAGPEGDAVFTGHAEIRGWYETLTAGKGVTTLSDCKADGETITCLDTYTDEGLKSLGVDFIEGDWVATVRDGKIQAYKFTMTPESLAKLPPPPQPTATLSPETPITSIEDVVGTWRIWVGGDQNELRFLPDGRFFVNENSSRGNFAVEGSQIHYLTESYCPSAQEARYEVFVTKQDNKPVKLRFVLVGEDGCPERKEALAGKTLVLVKP
ncbi:MAG: nuclear transport factor 2 family protein [Anaerolineales bacterium]|nr:nuclear transport factor 2 family protein [Anaerolineales bacterium]